MCGFWDDMTYAVVAAVRAAQLLREDDTSDEGEQGSEGVEDDQNDGDGDGFDEDGGRAVDPDEPAEGDGEHGIVGGWAVRGFAGEDVTDEGCEEDNPEELEPAEGNQDDAHDGGWGIIQISVVVV